MNNGKKKYLAIIFTAVLAAVSFFVIKTSVIDKKENIEFVEETTIKIEDINNTVVDENKAYRNEWVEYNGDKYYFGDDGNLVTSSWIGLKNYVDKDGKMLRNTKSPEGFLIDNDGNIADESRTALVFQELQKQIKGLNKK